MDAIEVLRQLAKMSSMIVSFNYPIIILLTLPGFSSVFAQADLPDEHLMYLPLVSKVPWGDMIYIPSGNFQMGCDPAHNGGYSCPEDELPLHSMMLDAFYIDKYEVTNTQYAACVAAGGCNDLRDYTSETRISYFNNPDFGDYPVVRADLNSALMYCLWLGKEIPTEAQWEKAARGSTDTRPYPWGNQTPTCAFGNFMNCNGDTMSVGSYPAGMSPYGVMDMTGNAMEWTRDAPYSYANHLFIAPYPLGPTTAMIRGGEWRDDTDAIRVTIRRQGHIIGSLLGFRCVASVP